MKYLGFTGILVGEALGMNRRSFFATLFGAIAAPFAAKALASIPPAGIKKQFGVDFFAPCAQMSLLTSGQFSSSCIFAQEALESVVTFHKATVLQETPELPELVDFAETFPFMGGNARHVVAYDSLKDQYRHRVDVYAEYRG